MSLGGGQGGWRDIGVALTLILTPPPHSGPLHRGRRAYLRGAVRELEALLEDQPGLLGPKVSTGGGETAATWGLRGGWEYCPWGWG